MSNYWKKRLGELNINNSPSTASSPDNYWQKRLTELNLSEQEADDDIAPVVTTKKEEDGLKLNPFPDLMAHFKKVGDIYKDDLAGTQIVKDTEEQRESGKTSFDQFVAANLGMIGLASFNKDLTATADVILGKPLQAIGWENNPISSVADYYSGAYDKYAERAKVTRDNTGWHTAGEMLEGTSAAVPHALLALATAGSSTATTTTTAGLQTTAAWNSGNLLTKAGLTVNAMGKNPSYWLSFAQTYGTDYEEALEKSGGDEVKAAFGATLTSLLNAGVEVGISGGSGIQGLPDKIAKGGKSAIWDWAWSSLEEGNEEVVQGVISRTVDKFLYGSDTNVIDGNVMAKEFGMGTAVGGILGGGQIVVQGAVNGVNNALVERRDEILARVQEADIDTMLPEEIDALENEYREIEAKLAEMSSEADTVRQDGLDSMTDEDAPPDVDEKVATTGVSPSEYERRVEEICDSISDLKRNQRKRVGGYSVGMYTRNGSEDITISITKPDGEIVREVIDGGKYWTNIQLQYEIASKIAETEGYTPPVDEVAPAPVTEEEMVETNIGKMSIEDYRDIVAQQRGYDDYADMRRQGVMLGNGYDTEAFDALTDADAPPVDEVAPAPVATEQTVAEDNAVNVADKPIRTAEERLSEKMANTLEELENNRRLREQAKADYETDIAVLQSKYKSLRNKNTIAANDLLRRIERTKRIAGNVDADYAKRISDLEAKVEKMNTPEYRTAEQRKVKQQEYSEQMENLIGDTTSWVDKKLGLSYKVNTLRRNLRYVVRDADGNPDIEKADAIYDELQGKYNHNEAQLNKESNSIKKAYADMKITKAEDTYIQMLGELRYNPSTTLTEDAVNEFYEKHKGSIDTAKVDKAIDMARKTYDELLVRVNEVLREQGMKEIPYRKGYFPHFTNPKQNWLAKLFNWKTIDTDIPTDIAGLTEEFNPNRSWQSFNKQRKGDDTDYSFTQGLDSYVHGALDWIYHIEDIQKRRAFENYIRYVHSEKGVQDKIDAIRKSEVFDADEMQKQIDLVYAEARNPLNNFVTDLRAGTNTLANKKSSMDRGLEEATNRKIYSVMTNVSNRTTANMVAGSVSSALTNFIPITQSWGQVSPISSILAAKDTIASAIRDDGMIDKSDFLTNRLRKEEALHKTTWDKVSEKATILMEVIDGFSSQVVWRSKYLENISDGMSETEAIKNADQFAENVLAGRSRGNQPTIFDSKNPFIKALTAFQLEVNNQYGYMFKDMPNDVKNKSIGRLVKGYATMFVGAYAYNALYSAMTGRDTAFDPIGIIEDLLRDLGLFGDDEEEEPVDVATGLIDNLLEEAPFVGGLFGGGRVPISSVMPYGGISEAYKGITDDVKAKDWRGLANELTNPLYYLAPPVGGGQIRKTVQGLSMFSDDHPVAGSYTTSGNLRFPVDDTLGNKVKAALFGQWASENAREYFDEGRAPLKEKQIQEYMDVDIPIHDYWEYREGLNKQKTLEDKFDYIAGLDLPVEKKNILINNVVDRKENVDMTGYDDFSTFEEFDFYSKNKEKYEFLQENGVDYEEYTRTVVRKEKYDAIYSWYKNNPEKVTVSRAVTDNVVEYRKYTGHLNDIRADKDSAGKSISGSAKAKKTKYINGLDIDYGAKLILFKSEYPADDTYNNDIVDYLNSRSDLSYEDTVTILKELGFEVDSKGNIYW